MQFLSPTSHISRAQQPHVARGYHMGQRRRERFCQCRKSYWPALAIEQIRSKPGFKVRLCALGLGTSLHPLRFWFSPGFSEALPAQERVPIIPSEMPSAQRAELGSCPENVFKASFTVTGSKEAV